jgi:transcriptional accessory protein Tex/SPT6
MATQRTRRLVASQDAARKLADAIGNRQRLYEEGVKLNRTIAEAQARLVEIDEDEEVYATAINAAGDVIAEAAAEDPPVREPA